MSCCRGIGRAVKNGAKIATGFAYLAGGINEELSKKRMRICSNCPKLFGGEVCSVCGCSVAAKTRLPEEECPLKRWIKSV